MCSAHVPLEIAPASRPEGAEGAGEGEFLAGVDEQVRAEVRRLLEAAVAARTHVRTHLLVGPQVLLEGAVEGAGEGALGAPVLHQPRL